MSVRLMANLCALRERFLNDTGVGDVRVRHLTGHVDSARQGKCGGSSTGIKSLGWIGASACGGGDASLAFEAHY